MPKSNAHASATEIETDRDRPTGAGAAPGRQDRQPRAETRRGRTEARSLQFYALLNQNPAIGPIPRHAIAGQTIARGEFRGLARWITGPVAAQGPKGSANERRAPTSDVQEEGSREEAELGIILAGIADDVRRHAVAACDAVTADFAARVAHARRHLSRDLLPATLSALYLQRRAALAAVKRNAAIELAGRKKAAIAARRRPAVNRAQNHPKPPPS